MSCQALGPLLVAGLNGLSAAATPRRNPGQGKVDRSDQARAEELRAALDGDAKITATDKTCKKLTCETVSTEHYVGITRAVARDNPDAKSVFVMHVDIDDVVAPTDYVASCARTWIVTDGPLEKLAVIADDSGTHFVTAAYLHPSTGHGFTAAQISCVCRSILRWSFRQVRRFSLP